MIKMARVLFGLFLFASPMWAQVYTVTGNVVDSDGQQWIGGSYQITLVNPQGLPNFYCTTTGQNFPASFGGTLDATGSFSVQLTSTACVRPTGSLWKFQVCPNVTGAACGTIQIPITAAGSISAQINAVILAPRVTGGPGIHAYSDTEVSAFSPNTYFNVISQQNRCYSTAWAVCGSGGGGGGLPSAAAAGAVPVSTGPGTTYAATPGATTTLELLTSTPPAASGPTTKACNLVNGGTVTSVTCTWSSPPQPGESLFCTVFGATGSTFTLSDSASDSYTPGLAHTNSAISTAIQQFSTAPITAQVTTTTVALSVSSFQPGILCNSANAIAASSPVDGTAVSDATSGPVSTSLTTTVAGDYIFCGGVGGASSGFAAVAPFTLGAQYSPYFNSINEYYLQPTAGAITPSISGTVVTSASLLCSAFKKASTPTAPTTTFTNAAPLINDNLIIINVKEWGAVGNGQSNPACTYLGLSTLAQLQAYQGGIYSFATSCTNQMDWLATQYAVNKLTGVGGQVKLAGGTYVWDQPVVLPAENLDDFPTAISISMVGDSNGGTFIIPATGDFGAGSGMLSCGPPGASYADNSGAGSGRYTATGGCPGDSSWLTFYNPYVSGTVNVTSTGYARGIINVPAPAVSGVPVQMDGVLVGARMYMHHVSAWDFRMAFNVVGDHMAWQDIYGDDSFCGMYFAPQSLFLQADLAMVGHDFIAGNTFGGFCIDKDAQLNLYQSGELYVGYQPYPFIKFPGPTDSYLGGGYFGFMEGGNYQNIQAENTGNAIFWDDNMTQTGGGVSLGESSIQGTTINQMYSSWGTRISTGGRNQYALFGAGEINGVTLKNVTLPVGGNGQLAGILAQYTGAGGGIDISGDITDPLISNYTALPFVGNTRAGYCSPVHLHQLGTWDGGEILLDTSVSSITAGQALTILADGNAGIATGTTPVFGVAAQSFTNPSGGQCLAYMSSGVLASPYTFSVPGSATGGNLIVSTTAGNGAAVTGAGGYVIGTALSSGTTPSIQLNGLGSYDGGAASGVTTVSPLSGTTTISCPICAVTGTNNNFSTQQTFNSNSSFGVFVANGATSGGAAAAIGLQAQGAGENGHQWGLLAQGQTYSGNGGIMSTQDFTAGQPGWEQYIDGSALLHFIVPGVVNSVLATEELVASSATPTFSINYRESTTVITANITSFTLASGSAGQEKTLTFCQNGTGGFTVAAPSNVHGFMTVGATASKCSSQHFTYNSIQTAWLADSPGVVNE